ncbi:hypothetical protein Skr01_23280 [Sphaerisporangium krabiense]|uniref:IgA peptidase M64 n=1 Tax=Sphaerisporangium krabiense TaxID=763782 RepID=A0A7W8Z630_9ACTN|nr:M64 family metallopeptidase [Sphaerisporangium krabiense]MBB5628076.1 hypothetical protein [Sphaerisporangium krabiense]GII62243.1 hypothetical protein Skr01_23280 [Sphaerisporangium krabiense]
MRRFPLLMGAVLASVSFAVPAAAGDTPPTRRMEVFAEDGTITRAEVTPPSPRPHARATGPAGAVTPVEVNGPSDHRIDLVFLGDGYTAGEQGSYAGQVKANWELLAAREPFKSYRKLFNVWRVDIVSPVSGVSGDPTADVVKNTPLGSAYWCDGLERLLCADVDAARSYAALAPDADQIALLANSAKYGGAGYTDEELVTFSGGHPLAGEILPHELGHSLGDLADEYPYYSRPGDGSEYTGPERPEANVSIRDAARMTAEQAKWFRWLGEPTPDGGAIGAFEGALYTEKGIYRPSDDSLMRTLRREFNLVGRERMIKSFYDVTGLIDARTPGAAPVPRKSTLSIRPVPVEGLDIRWYVDGHERRPWAGRTSVTVNGQGDGGEVTVVVTDRTPSVRDPAYRADALTESVTWKVSRK